MQRLPPPLVTEPEAIWAQPWPQAPSHFNHATSAPAHECLPSPHLNLLHGPNRGSREPHATHASRVSPCSIRPDAADWTASILGLSRCQPKRRTRCDGASQRDDLLRAPHLSLRKTAWSLSSAARALAPGPSLRPHHPVPAGTRPLPAVDSWYEHALCDWTPPLCQGSLFENARTGACGWKAASGIAPGVATPAFDPHTHGLQNEHFDGDLFTEPYYGEILPVLRYQVAATM
ncbi:hypothetical protein B0H14DRAFT_2740248 [Mycena olivaceomarginata]|nr:hypothetical protein B0H14DRAFT_2740248 [Mycena olivaceomarginata]